MLWEECCQWCARLELAGEIDDKLVMVDEFNV